MSEEMKEYKLSLQNISQVGEDYYIFDFDKPEGFTFKEGQYGVFKHVDKEVEGKAFRAFSIASSNHEESVRIATKIIEEPSDFKRIMRNLKKGELMSFTGFMGNFTLEQTHHSIFIAGGIGITPIRGIIASLQSMNYEMDANLIYSEPRKIYPFKDEFDESKVNSYYAYTIDNTKMLIEKFAKKFVNTGYYYIAGSNNFVNAVKEQLQSLGVNVENIKFDRFTGY